MAKRTRVVVRDSAIKGLVRDPGVQADIDRRAQKVLDQARAIAPVLSGEYRAKLHLEKTSGTRGGEAVRVTAGTDHDIYVEAQDGTLSRALDAAAD